MEQPVQMGQGLYRQTRSEDTQDKSKDAEGPRLGVSREVGKKVCMCECGPRSWRPGRSPAVSGEGRSIRYHYAAKSTALKNIRGLGWNVHWGSVRFPGESNGRNIWRRHLSRGLDRI